MRHSPLQDERVTAKIGQGISLGLNAESPSNALREHANPPLEYAQARVFETSSDGKSAPPGSPSGARGVVHGLLQSALAQSLPHEVQDLLADARRHGAERRAYGREPYLHPAVLQLEDTGERHSAFIRDVSSGGVGLLHFVSATPQRAQLMTRRMNDEIISVGVDIAWCVPCGEGCFMSGGTFVKLEDG